MIRLLYYVFLFVISFLIGHIPYLILQPKGWELISWQLTYWPAIFIIDLLIVLFVEYRNVKNQAANSYSLNVMSHLGKFFGVIDTLIFIYFTMNTLLKVQLELVSPMLAVYHLCGIMFAYVVLMILLMRRQYI